MKSAAFCRWIRRTSHEWKRRRNALKKRRGRGDFNGDGLNDIIAGDYYVGDDGGAIVIYGGMAQ